MLKFGWSCSLVEILKLRLVKILKFKFSRNADIWLRFSSSCLVEIMKMKSDHDLFENSCYDKKKLFWYCRTQLSGPLCLWQCFPFNSYTSTDFFFFWFMQIIRETKYSYQFPSTSPWPLNLPINDLYLQTASNIEAIYTRNTYRWPIRFRTGHITENTAYQGFGGKVFHILGCCSNIT